jgi:hypothetical protein
MSSSEIEPWNSIAESWHRRVPHMHTWYAPPTESILVEVNLES